MPRLIAIILAVLTEYTSIAASTLEVAVVQLRSSTNLADNTDRIATHIQKAAGKGADVVVFPECALSGYFEDVITRLSSDELEKAEQKLAQACKDSGAYAIIGAPSRVGDKLYNSALIFSPEGKIIERYHKIQLAEGWPEPGDHMSVFKIRGVPCSVIVCHDERYPELVRLPVLAGAQVIFYISHESGLREEHKIEPYRAQIQARAVENTVYVVQANAPANKDTTGSHGHSRIISPDGAIIREASIFREEVLSATLDIARATRNNALNSIKRGPLKDWWRDGVKRVRVLD